MNITKHRRIWFAFSGILVGASIGLTLFFGLNLGLDFLGGIRWTISLENDEINQIPNVETVQKFFDAQKSEKQRLTKDVKIQKSETGDFLITLENLSEESFAELKSDMNEKFLVDQKSFRRVDPSIGESFKSKAFYAIIASLIGIIFFVAWAFRKIPASISPWRFGGVAIVALFHDILIVLGVFTILGALSGVELDLQFITALLATLGFSVNDTIVILDRVRENIRLQKATEDFEDVVEKSVKQTLLRSVNTSVSTLLPLLALLFWGADSIFYFILALSVAIVVGTYSSIFLAAPMLVSWKKLADR